MLRKKIRTTLVFSQSASNQLIFFFISTFNQKRHVPRLKLLWYISRYLGAWRSSMTGSWLPGTTAGRLVWPTKWPATGSPSLWTTARAPSPSPRWEHLAAWPTSTRSLPRLPTRCAWASDSTKLSSTAAFLSSKSELEREGQGGENNNFDETMAWEKRQWFVSVLLEPHDPEMEIFAWASLMFPQI